MTSYDRQATSIHVRAARAGDETSLTWIIGRFSPLLLSQARYRTSQAQLADLDPDDLVQETWRVALPRLESIHERDGRVAPVLLSFLSTTLLQITNNHIRKSIRRGQQALETRDARDSRVDPARLVAAVEEKDRVLATLEALEERDRAIVVLRIIEGLSNTETAKILGTSANACSLRYNRVLARLRSELPRSIFEELGEDDDHARD